MSEFVERMVSLKKFVDLCRVKYTLILHNKTLINNIVDNVDYVY